MSGGAPSSGFTGKTESFNGSTWSETADLNDSKRGLAGCGSSNTNALVFGGQQPPAPSGTYTADTEKWNGTSWSQVADLNLARNQFAGVGTNTAALGFGGRQPGRNQQQTEKWNGTSWTELGS